MQNLCQEHKSFRFLVKALFVHWCSYVALFESSRKGTGTYSDFGCIFAQEQATTIAGTRPIAESCTGIDWKAKQKECRVREGEMPEFPARQLRKCSSF
jgi:hypothetical protein